MNKFGRIIEFHVGEKVWKYPELDIEFEINFDTETNGNTGNIKLYNLNNNSIAQLKKDTDFVLKAGYQGDVGKVMQGKIASSETKFENESKFTKVVLEEDVSVITKTQINRTWGKDIQADIIIRDIIKETGITIGRVKISSTIKYSKGKTFSCDAKKALESLAQDTQSKVHISRGKIYFLPQDQSISHFVKLSKDSGLIASPQKIDSEDGQRWKVQSLLRHEIEPDVSVDIKSLTLNGTCRVVKGKHSSDFITEFEVIKIAD